MAYTSKRTGQEIDDLLDIVAQGNAGGGDSAENGIDYAMSIDEPFEEYTIKVDADEEGKRIIKLNVASNLEREPSEFPIPNAEAVIHYVDRMTSEVDVTKNSYDSDSKRDIAYNIGGEGHSMLVVRGETGAIGANLLIDDQGMALAFSTSSNEVKTEADEILLTESEADSRYAKKGEGGGGSSVDVVDNLTTADPTKALSANMGKVLNEKSKNLEERLNELASGGGGSVESSSPTLIAEIKGNDYDVVLPYAYPTAYDATNNILTIPDETAPEWLLNIEESVEEYAYYSQVSMSPYRNLYNFQNNNSWPNGNGDVTLYLKRIGENQYGVYTDVNRTTKPTGANFATYVTDMCIAWNHQMFWIDTDGWQQLRIEMFLIRGINAMSRYWPFPGITFSTTSGNRTGNPLDFTQTIASFRGHSNVYESRTQYCKVDIDLSADRKTCHLLQGFYSMMASDPAKDSTIYFTQIKPLLDNGGSGGRYLALNANLGQNHMWLNPFAFIKVYGLKKY